MELKVIQGITLQIFFYLLREDCQHFLQHDFVFQQDGAPFHTQQTQEWLSWFYQEGRVTTKLVRPKSTRLLSLEPDTGSISEAQA